MAYKNLTYDKININGGFWQRKQEMLRKATVWAVYERFKETGRFDAFECKKDAPIKPHIFWDSDVAKWIEGVAYLTKIEKEPELEKIVDHVVDLIEKNQREDGYYNSYFLACEPEGIFKNRDNHELYCLGHLIEASIAYYDATGKKKLLDLMLKYVDYVEYRFKIKGDTGFKTPGHEEIELSLVRLYDLTGEKKHLDLARYFVAERGKESEDPLNGWANSAYLQSHKIAKEQFTAEGHSVRATYFYSAMADLALRDGDDELKIACEKIFDDILNHKMYITGGIGSTHQGEAFTIPYDLPSEGAYAESCAAIGLVFFAERMLLLTGEKKYADVIERVLYNGFLSSISLDGKSFFYVNPLKIVKSNHYRHASVSTRDPLPPMTRYEVFECSCCPPNIVRFLGSLSSLAYTFDENAVYLQQYMSCDATFNIGGKETTLTQRTNYPENGKISLEASEDLLVYVRVPEYLCGENTPPCGYIPLKLKAGREQTIEFEIPTMLVEASPQVADAFGKVAVMHGPIVYCLEGHDNENKIDALYINKDTNFVLGFNSKLGVPTITVDAYVRKETGALYSQFKNSYTKSSATLIPYYAFANRGESDMQVWTLTR